MANKKTLILGASTNPARYAYSAAERLTRAGHVIVLVGNKKGEVAGVEIQQDLEGIGQIDTVTMYLGQKNQLPYEDFLLKLKPKRIIFNPGAENPELMENLIKEGVDAFEACTLVMLGTKQF
jgi:predicted CoA-binding protein